MLERDTELELFKRRINLTEYAAGHGYCLVRDKRGRTSVVMENTTGDKVVIARDVDGHWIYFSVHNDADNGSIVDFVQNRQGGSLGDVRKELRPWIGDHAAPRAHIPREHVAEELVPGGKDMARVRAAFEAMTPVAGGHRYLEKERLIPRDVLASPRFAGRILIDNNRAAVFPHYNRDGLCGFELKNRNFTSFAAGGEKGLWGSRTSPDDTVLVITETAIDALSHFALKRLALTRYVSIGGALNLRQPDLLRSAMEKMPEGGKIACAMDNDEGGDSLTAQMKAIFAEIPARGCVLIEDRPPHRGDDWNDVLRASMAKAPPVSKLSL